MVKSVGFLVDLGEWVLGRSDRPDPTEVRAIRQCYLRSGPILKTDGAYLGCRRTYARLDGPSIDPATSTLDSVTSTLAPIDLLPTRQGYETQCTTNREQCDDESKPGHSICSSGFFRSVIVFDRVVVSDLFVIGCLIVE